MITVYAAYYNSDMAEGRGPILLDKAFTYQLDAYEYINSQTGVMGRSAHPVDGWHKMGDWKVEPIQVYDSLQDAINHAEETLRESALSKLTLAERKALGL